MAAPTLTALNTASYDGSSTVMPTLTATTFKERLFAPFGKTARIWKSVPLPDGGTGPNGEARERNGNGYIGLELESTVKVLFFQGSRMITGAAFGALDGGDISVWVLPHEVELSRFDRIAANIASGAAHSWLFQETITRGAAEGTGNGDTLTKWPAHSIDSVLFEGDYISPSEWTLTNNGKQLEWISGASVEEDDVYTISGRFAPRFECVGNESPIVQVGADGVTLPQKWQLRLLQPGEFEL